MFDYLATSQRRSVSPLMCQSTEHTIPNELSLFDDSQKKKEELAPLSNYGLIPIQWRQLPINELHWIASNYDMNFRLDRWI